jgi:hypothetical protein
VDRALGTADDIDPLLQRQSAFWAFVEAFTAVVCGFVDDPLSGA